MNNEILKDRYILVRVHFLALCEGGILKVEKSEITTNSDAHATVTLSAFLLCLRVKSLKLCSMAVVPY